MSNQTDYDQPGRPSTAQPPPEHVPGAASVHDLVAADIAGEYPSTWVAPVLAMLEERKAFGLAKYGTVLQVEDPRRRPEMDLLEELGDALVYAFRAKAHGMQGAGLVYAQLQELAVSAAALWYPASGRRA